MVFFKKSLKLIDFLKNKDIYPVLMHGKGAPALAVLFCGRSLMY